MSDHGAAPMMCILLAACGGAGGGALADQPERLEGEWVVEMRLEHPATLTRDVSGLAPVRGTVVLLENDGGQRFAAPSGVPTHYGVYSADLRALDVHGGSEVPTLVARLAGRDSVEMAFDPGSAHAITGAGRLAGDSVTGRWWQGGGRTAGRSSGIFVMRRP